MYSFADLEPVCCSTSSSNCCFLTCIQISQETGQVVCFYMNAKNRHSSGGTSTSIHCQRKYGGKFSNTYLKSSCMRCTVALQTQTFLPYHQNFARLLWSLLVSLLQHSHCRKILQASVWLLAAHFTCPTISSILHYRTVSTFHRSWQFVLKTECFYYV